MSNSSIQSAYLRHMRREKRAVTFARIALFVLFIALWEMCSRTGIIDAFIFSSPTRIVKTFLEMVHDHTIFRHTWITIAETGISFSLIVILGIGCAILIWYCRPLSKVLEPYLVLLNSLPKSALAPMIIVWLGNNAKAIIVTAISVAVFGTVLNIYTSFADTDKEKIRLIKTLGGSKFSVLTKVVLPSSLPTIVSNLKVNIGLSLVGVIIGEFLAAKAGLGYLIIYGSQVFKMDYVAMSIVLLCILSVILFKIIDFIEKSIL